jgi:hypothetical protein
METNKKARRWEKSPAGSELLRVDISTDGNVPTDPNIRADNAGDSRNRNRGHSDNGHDANRRSHQER